MKRKRIFGFTLIELLVVVAIIALLISILLPSLSRARELSKRVVCGSNMSGLGKSCKIYANENLELWPIPAFDQTWTNQAGGTNRIKYVEKLTNQQACVCTGGMCNPPGQCATNPSRCSASQPLCGTAAGSQEISTTRAFWMLVRAGDMQAKSFICPSSSDQTDPTAEIDSFYDFESANTVSYGYQVPFGPAQSRPSENLDSRMAMAADKGPWYELSPASPPSPADTNNPDEKSSPNEWRRFNSPNHGGKGAGEGQNVLFQDGHASFERTPIVGVDQDNIYTLMVNNARDRKDRQIGKAPGQGPPPHAVPGDKTFGNLGGPFGSYASTDSLIYP